MTVSSYRIKPRIVYLLVKQRMVPPTSLEQGGPSTTSAIAGHCQREPLSKVRGPWFPSL